VMVARLNIVVVWGEEAGGAVANIDCTLPPSIVATPNAANIHAAMFSIPTAHHIVVAREILLSRVPP